MILNPIFTTDLIVTRVVPIVCCIKQQINFIKCQILARRTIGIFIDIPNSISYFWQPCSLLLPIRSAAGYDPTCLCGFRHYLGNVSTKHGADDSALTYFFFL